MTTTTSTNRTFSSLDSTRKQSQPPYLSLKREEAGGRAEVLAWEQQQQGPRRLHRNRTMINFLFPYNWKHNWHMPEFRVRRCGRPDGNNDHDNIIVTVVFVLSTHQYGLVSAVASGHDVRPMGFTKHPPMPLMLGPMIPPDACWNQKWQHWNAVGCSTTLT